MKYKWRLPIQEYCIDYSKLEPPSLLVNYSMIDVDFHEESITLPEGKFDLKQVLFAMKQIDKYYGAGK